MSGDSGRHTPPTGRPAATADMCSKLSFETQVSNVDESVLETIAVGHIVDIGLLSSGGIESVAVFYGQSILGGIGRDGYMLKDCLRKGFEYVAEVRSIQHGVVKIFVFPNGN